MKKLSGALCSVFCLFAALGFLTSYMLPPSADGRKARGDYRMMFYNLENFFDPFDDSLTRDEEFLPQGNKRWGWDRYKRKCCKIGQVIIAVGGWEAPELVGLCEVENSFVLDGLIKYSPLSKANYKIIHNDSPDKRGIDVALLYKAERFKPLNYRFINVVFPGQRKSDTRQILYVKGVTHTQDTIHVLVNHWPSRWGGQAYSEYRRIAAARVVRSCLDSLFYLNKKGLVVVMGDFNDSPDSPSVSTVLNAQTPVGEICDFQIYNLAAMVDIKSIRGSYKYKGRWEMFDQILVSGALLNGRGFLYCNQDKQNIFSPDFLLEQDAVYYGRKPFRTFQGLVYRDGFSDHLPVYLDLWRKIEPTQKKNYQSDSLR